MAIKDLTDEQLEIFATNYRAAKKTEGENIV